jgi:hypothetical protein
VRNLGDSDGLHKYYIELARRVAALLSAERSEHFVGVNNKLSDVLIAGPCGPAVRRESTPLRVVVVYIEAIAQRRR